MIRGRSPTDDSQCAIASALTIWTLDETTFLGGGTPLDLPRKIPPLATGEERRKELHQMMVVPDQSAMNLPRRGNGIGTIIHGSAHRRAVTS